MNLPRSTPSTVQDQTSAGGVPVLGTQGQHTIETCGKVSCRFGSSTRLITQPATLTLLSFRKEYSRCSSEVMSMSYVVDVLQDMMVVNRNELLAFYDYDYQITSYHATRTYHYICLTAHSADTCTRINIGVHKKWNVDFGIW